MLSLLNNLKKLPQMDVTSLHRSVGSAASMRGDIFYMGEEIWKPVSECTNYEISNYRRVRSLLPCKKGHEPYYLKIFISKTGYYVVNLWINGNRRIRKLHRLYAIEFIPNPLNLPEINHLDGNKLNNEYDNLEWCTAVRNKQHAFETGLVPKVLGQNQSSTILLDEQVLLIYKSSKTISELSKEFNVSNSAIASIKNGKTWGWLTGKTYVRKRERSKISNEDVLQIFNSTETFATLSKKYNVSMSCIGFIKTGRSYSNITGKIYKAAYRLNSVQINEILRSKSNNKSLAAKYKVHKDTIRNIKNGAYNYDSRS